MSDDTMELWNQVCTSDPDTVKKMTHGAKLSAVDAHSQLKRATELWGPYGMDWGLTDMKWGYVMDAKAGVPINITLEAQFYYPYITEDKIEHHPRPIRVSFPIASDIQFNAKGECRKKLMTDVTTKALSKVGFNADVFMGRFDDNRYVQELRQAKNVVSLQDEKDKQTANFIAAVSEMAGTELILRVLGVNGYESLEEITTSETRRGFVALLREEVNKS